MIALIAAESREFAGLVPHLEGRRRLKWSVDFALQGVLKGKDVVLVANGPGPKLARAAVDEVRSRVPKLEKLVSTGYCGALDPNLRACDVVRAAEGEFVSNDRVVVTKWEKAQLRETGAKIVEMEAGAVAERARKWNVAFECIRVVTDTAEEGFVLDFNQMRGPDGRFSRFKIALTALRRPWTLIPALARLDRTCKRASLALGDFLADCAF